MKQFVGLLATIFDTNNDKDVLLPESLFTDAKMFKVVFCLFYNIYVVFFCPNTILIKPLNKFSIDKVKYNIFHSLFECTNNKQM